MTLYNEYLQVKIYGLKKERERESLKVNTNRNISFFSIISKCLNL